MSVTSFELNPVYYLNGTVCKQDYTNDFTQKSQSNMVRCISIPQTPVNTHFCLTKLQICRKSDPVESMPSLLLTKWYLVNPLFLISFYTDQMSRWGQSDHRTSVKTQTWLWSFQTVALPRRSQCLLKRSLLVYTLHWNQIDKPLDSQNTCYRQLQFKQKSYLWEITDSQQTQNESLLSDYLSRMCYNISLCSANAENCL